MCTLYIRSGRILNFLGFSDLEFTALHYLALGWESEADYEAIFKNHFCGKPGLCLIVLKYYNICYPVTHHIKVFLLGSHMKFTIFVIF